MNVLYNRFRLIVMLIGALALIFSSASLYRSAKAAAQNAADSHAECQRFVEDIRRFRDAPRIASLDVESTDRIAARVTSAATDSVPAALARVWETV